MAYPPPQGARLHASPPPWTPPVRHRIAGALGVLGGILAALALTATLALIVADAGGGATVIASLLALVPLSVVLLAVRWLDRWEPEPRGALLFALLWGAGVATLLSLIINTSVATAVYEITLDARQAELVGAVFVAPVVEESAKGLGVLAIFLARRHYFDTPVDGVVYAAMSAAGFAFVENILYFGDSLDVLPQIFFMRGILSPFAHVLFSAFIGLALGLAARQARGAWLPALPLGWLLAVGLHALWNLSAFSGSFFGVYIVVQMPLFATMVAVMWWLRRREQAVLRQRLTEYGRAGWLAPFEIAMLTSLPHRRRARQWAARCGRAGAMEALQRSATRLAFTRHRTVTGRAAPSDLAYERHLLAQVAAARRQLEAAT